MYILNGSLGSSGSGIDMVGCHNGRINKCTFENMGANSIQMKGGSQYIRIEKTFLKRWATSNQYWRKYRVGIF
ncbi:MAG: hypothetical protein IPK88_00320 [Saprospiraceae bacterium]|nr:hypothetical protein [Candidatus Defluviibacterium haderslevense]